jgi:hypothetical protein
VNPDIVVQANEATWRAAVPYLDAFVAGPVQQVTGLQSTAGMSPDNSADERLLTS